MSNTSKLIFLSRIDSDIKKEVHNKGLEILKTTHDGSLTILEFRVPEKFDVVKFQNDMRHKFKHVI